MRNIGRAVEKLVDAVSAICPDNTTVPALRMLLDDVAVFAEKRAWLDNLNRLVQAFARSLSHPHSVWVRERLVSNVVSLVQIRVETAVVDGDVDVENISILEYSLVGDAVADDLVERRAYRLGKMAVVEGRWVRLRLLADCVGHILQLSLHPAQPSPCGQFRQCNQS